MKVKTQKYIEDVLYDKKLLSEDQVSAIKLEVLNTGRTSEDIIRERNYVSSEELAKAKGLLYDIPYIDLKDTPISSEVLELIPESIAKNYQLIPFDKKNKFLHVAMADPLDLQIVEFLERRVGISLKTYISDPDFLKKIIEDQYSKSIGQDVTQALEEFAGTEKIEESISD